MVVRNNATVIILRQQPSFSPSSLYPYMSFQRPNCRPFRTAAYVRPRRRRRLYCPLRDAFPPLFAHSAHQTMGDGRNQDGEGRESRRRGATNWRIDKQKRRQPSLSLSLSLSAPKGRHSKADWHCLADRQAECFFSSRLMPPPPPVDSINLVSLLGKRERERERERH